MGFLDRLRPKAMSPTQEAMFRMAFGGGGSTNTGITVTTESAMRAMAVHSCVTIKANSFSQLPCHLMIQKGENKKQAIHHPLYSLLHDQPNSWMTAPEFWGMASACLDLRGNFFALKSGLPGRPIRELIPLAIGSVQEVDQTTDYKLFYKVVRPQSSTLNSSGEVIGVTGSTIDIIPGDRIMHLRGLVLNGFMGISPIQYARESIALALATEKHGAKLFSQGTMLGGILTMEGTFKDREKAAKFVDDFNAAHSSIENAHKTILLEQNVKYEKLGMTSVDAQFLEARGFQKKEIVDLFFQIPLAMMSTGDKTATYASAGTFSQDYVNYALMPRIVNVERAIYRDLLTPDERDRTQSEWYYAKFSAEALLRGNMNEQSAFYKEMVNAEIMNPNEVRALMEFNPYPGGDRFSTRTSTTKDNRQSASQEETT